MTRNVDWNMTDHLAVFSKAFNGNDVGARGELASKNTYWKKITP
jgi:hypothetical protein